MKKKILATLLVGAMMVSLAACGGKSEGGESSSSSEMPILGTGIYSSSDNFNSYIGKSISNAADGVFQTNIEDGQNDQSTQTNQVDTMLAKGAKVIAISVVDVTAAPTIIDKARNAGEVPIIFFNKEITDADAIQGYDKVYQVTSTAGDYGATIQGEMIVEEWEKNPKMDKNGDGKLQMVIIVGDPGHTAAAPRAEYVKKAVEDGGIGVDVLAEDTGMWDTAKAKDKMDAWISKYGDSIECIATGNDAMALGALTSIEAAGFNQNGKDGEKYIPIIGIDALPEVLEKIEAGTMLGSVLQDAKTQGEVIVKMAENLMNGDAVDKGLDSYEGLINEIDSTKAMRVPYRPITAENLDVARDTYK